MASAGKWSIGRPLGEGTLAKGKVTVSHNMVSIFRNFLFQILD